MNSDSSEYWFIPYDREFQLNEFTSINFSRYESLVISLPQFQQLSGEYSISSQRIEQVLQRSISKIIASLMEFFKPTSKAIQSYDNSWIQFIENTQHFLNCEKLYALFFWQFHVNNTFVLKRLYGFFFRLNVFLESLHQAVFKNISEKDKKTKSLQTLPKEYVHINRESFSIILDLLGKEVEEIQNETIRGKFSISETEMNIFSQLHVFSKMFITGTFIEIQRLLRKYPDTQVMIDIIHENQHSLKELDDYLQLKADDTKYNQSLNNDGSWNSNNQIDKIDPRMLLSKSQSQQQKKKTSSQSSKDPLVPVTFNKRNSIRKSIRFEKSEESALRMKLFQESDNFSKSQNTSFISTNQMVQQQLPTVQDYTKQEIDQNNDNNSSSSASLNSTSIFQGIKVNKKIVTTLQGIKSRQDFSKKKLTNGNSEQGEDCFGDEETEDDRELEEFYQDDQTVRSKNSSDYFRQSKNRISGVDFSNTIEFVKSVDERLIEIKDSDIDLEQNKTNRQIYRTDDAKLNQSSTQEVKTPNVLNVSTTVELNKQETKDTYENEDYLQNDGDVDLNYEYDNDSSKDNTFDYSFEKDDYEDTNEIKFKVPFTPFKNRTENSFMKILKESIISPEEERENMDKSEENFPEDSLEYSKRRLTALSLKDIFQDKKVAYFNGNSFLQYLKSNFWMGLSNYIKKHKITKISEYYLAQTTPFPTNPPPLIKKRLSSCEHMQINY